jgi:D-xylose reductase
MEALQEKGLTKNIGVSNIQFTMFREIFQYCKIKPAVLQIEMHPFCIQADLVRFVKNTGTQMMGYSNLGGSSYVEIGLAGENDILTETPTMKELAAKYNKTAAQICLKWGVQRGTAIVPKTANPARLIENINFFDFEMTAEDMASIDKLNRNQRYNDPANYCEKFMNTHYPMYC